MIKLFSNRALRFQKDERDKNSDTVLVKVGFNAVPDWVQLHDYYKLCERCGWIHPYQSKDENALKEAEKSEVEYRKEESERVAIIDDIIAETCEKTKETTDVSSTKKGKTAKK